MTDTDSCLVEIKTKDLYKDMQTDEHLYDLSNFQPELFFNDAVNKKVFGKFKDECPINPAKEFIGLKPKMYGLNLGLVK